MGTREDVPVVYIISESNGNFKVMPDRRSAEEAILGSEINNIAMITINGVKVERSIFRSAKGHIYYSEATARRLGI